jgi:MFS family permease
MATTTQTVHLDDLTPALHLHHLQAADTTILTTDSSPEPAVPPQPQLTTLRKSIITLQLSGTNFLSSLATGLLTVGLPSIAADLGLPAELLLWPASVYGLATGSTLLLAGSVADIIGVRSVDLAGCFALGAFLLGSGFARTGEQLVAFRAVAGVAQSLHLSASVALVAAALPKGRQRNVAFSCLGLSQPLGFSVGLVVGGVLVDTIGWRTGWWLAGGLTLLLALVGLWALPAGTEQRGFKGTLQELKTKVDWVGAALASTFMATLSYFLTWVASP